MRNLKYKTKTRRKKTSILEKLDLGIALQRLMMMVSKACPP